MELGGGREGEDGEAGGGEGGEAFSPSLIRAVGGTYLGPYAMHGSQGAWLHAPRVAPARIVAAELLRPRAELHMLSRAHFASAACADDQHTRTHQSRPVEGRGEVTEGQIAGHLPARTKTARLFLAVHQQFSRRKGDEG